MKDQLTELCIDVVPDGAGATVVLAGEIDLATAPELQARLESLIDATTGDVAVDVARVTFLDSTGLHVIALVHRRLRDESRQLRVFNPATRCDVFSSSAGWPGCSRWSAVHLPLTRQRERGQGRSGGRRPHGADA